MYIGTCTDIIADSKVMFLIHEKYMYVYRHIFISRTALFDINM